MPTDTFYGSECEMRLGIMPDKNTDPASWQTLEFISATFTPQRERKARPKLGSARNNPLDPIKPIKGFERLTGDVVVDADSVQLPFWLVALLGLPASSGPTSSLYTHLWTSGVTTAALACIQVRTGDDEIRVYRGLTLGALSVQATGEQTEDFNIQMSLRGFTSTREEDWLSGSAEDVPAASPILRTVFRVDGTAADNTLDASWSWDRQLVEDVFLSPTPHIAGLRPGQTGLTGRARFRAVAGTFDTIEENDTVIAPDLQMLGVTSGHQIKFAHPHAQLSAAPLAIPGGDLIERTFDWFGFQDASTPGAKLTIINGAAGYD